MATAATPTGTSSYPTSNSNPGASKKSKRDPGHPIMGPSDPIGEGDSRIVFDAIGEDIAGDEDVFNKVKNEVHWQKMYHAHGEVPRLVCCQGEIGEDGSVPVYRHPADQSLPLLRFSPTVRAICDKVEAIVGHRMNHVLIQLYRGGNDYISEHSDKSLDIFRGSAIVNVSLGAQRTMRLRTKRSARQETEDGLTARKTQLVPMPHGSVFVLGPKSNMRWLHGINADKRPSNERQPSELSFNGERISFTFRNIATYLSSDGGKIWGQGARSKAQGEANPVISGDSAKAQEMINAFGMENQLSTFDWYENYGRGFDVLHFTQSEDALQDPPLLFLSGSETENSAAKERLEQLGILYRTTGVQSHEAGLEYHARLCFRDNDARKTEVEGVTAVLEYLGRRVQFT